jgi:hypothetical protein
MRRLYMRGNVDNIASLFLTPIFVVFLIFIELFKLVKRFYKFVKGVFKKKLHPA